MNKAGTCKKLLEPGNKKDRTNKWLTSYGRFLLFPTILKLTSSPWLKPGDSHPHEWAFLLRWRLASTVCIRICSYIASTGMTFRKPCGSSQFCDSSESLVITIWQGERECILVKHARAFTQANDLAWNPQTLFRCQGTTSLFSHTSEKTERGGAFIPLPFREGVFPRRLIKVPHE